MKNINKQKLLDAMRTSDPATLRRALRIIVADEIESAATPAQMKAGLRALADTIEVPFATEYRMPESAPQNTAARHDSDLVPLAAAAIVGATAGALTRRLKPLVTALLTGASAFAAAVAAKTIMLNAGCTTKQTQLSPKPVCTILSTPDEIAAKVDSIVNSAVRLVSFETKRLSESYPNVLKWLQEAYSECADFGAECEKFFKKRIDSLIYQCDYTLHNYDGTNAGLFTVTEDADVAEPVQALPAITDKNGYLLRGHLFVPVKK